MLPVRGNVPTRAKKAATGEVDAVVLAAAGIKRLGLALDGLVRLDLDETAFVSAPGQGALAIETREADREAPWVAALRCETTTLCVAAERGALTALEGSCKTPVGAHAWLEGGSLKLIVEALSPDGELRFRRAGETEISQLSDPMASARDLGLSLGHAVKDEAGDAIVL